MARSSSVHSYPRLARTLGLILLGLVPLAFAACGENGTTSSSSPPSASRPRDARRQQVSTSQPVPEPGQPDRPREPEHNTEAYDRIDDNPFLAVAQDPLSTFSIDVDTASYSNVRRFLNEGKQPPKDAVRIEELINYFRYDYPQPDGEHPVAMDLAVASCPWNGEHRLVRIGLRGRSIDREDMPPRNLVFLIDVSGSMQPENRLPLVKKSLLMLVEQLTANDRVAIVVYAGSSGLVLPATRGSEKAKIRAALQRLQAGGSTNGGQGIELAYRVAEENLQEDGVNRVILCTDGDFNVGITNQGDLTRLIEAKKKSGIFLTVLGFGMGNLKDSTLEKLAHYGNGHYDYIDSEAEARKVFVEQGGALVTIATDVKIQVEFNPEQVSAYRLLGYENRLLRHQEFNDDQKDAGDMGSGHTVTALYEIVPAGKKPNVPGVDPLKYQRATKASPAATSGELLTVKLRYKEPKEEKSKLLSQALKDKGQGIDEAPADFRFAAAVAGFGMLLRDSPYKGEASYAQVLQLAQEAKGKDPEGHRGEFIDLVRRARGMAKKVPD